MASRTRSPGSSTGARSATPGAKRPRLLAGGNPQIAKGHGDAPVQAFIAAVPDWKQKIVRWVDATVARAVPEVRKAVKYNSPLYGARGRDDWFLSVHCFARYVKVAFFRGTALDPLPPGASKQKDVRYLDIHENEPPDARQFASWVKQASKLPGAKL
jgi:hypothetical protein